jgi:hypothetical protein
MKRAHLESISWLAVTAVVLIAVSLTQMPVSPKTAAKPAPVASAQPDSDPLANALRAAPVIATSLSNTPKPAALSAAAP